MFQLITTIIVMCVGNSYFESLGINNQTPITEGGQQYGLFIFLITISIIHCILNFCVYLTDEFRKGVDWSEIWEYGLLYFTILLPYTLDRAILTILVFIKDIMVGCWKLGRYLISEYKTNKRFNKKGYLKC